METLTKKDIENLGFTCFNTNSYINIDLFLYYYPKTSEGIIQISRNTTETLYNGFMRDYRELEDILINKLNLGYKTKYL